MNIYDYLYAITEYGINRLSKLNKEGYKYWNENTNNFIYDYEIIIFDLSSIEANEIVLALDNIDRS